MKTTTAIGMKRPVCANCFEYPENCVGCEWNICAICKEEVADSECYEYRGVMACEKDFDELIKKRDEQRERVMEVTNASVKSQRNGEFVNNKSNNNFASDGLPIVKVKEPQILKDYENGLL